jgi:hypothetical protein
MWSKIFSNYLITIHWPPSQPQSVGGVGNCWQTFAPVAIQLYRAPVTQGEPGCCVPTNHVGMFGLVLNREMPFAKDSPMTYMPMLASVNDVPPGSPSTMDLPPAEPVTPRMVKSQAL